MSVAGWKKKKEISRVVFGAGIAGIPLLLCVIVLGSFCINLKEEVKSCKSKIKGKIFQTAYCLKEGKKTGEQIEEGDLEKITLLTEKAKRIPVMSFDSLVGKVLRADLEKGSIVSRALITDGESTDADARRCTYSGISYAKDIKAGSVVDIRISFPNGEDYVVIRHKEVLLASEEDSLLTLFLGEAELLRLSSAFVDQAKYKDVKLYAVSYRDGMQEEARITYPVNFQVYDLTGWDPNVIRNDGVESIETESRSEQQIRRQLEENLAPYLLQMGNVQTQSEQSQKEAAESKLTENGTEEFFP